MPRNHTVVFGRRDEVTSVICASGTVMKYVDNDIWECNCCDCYLILDETETPGERAVKARNCSKHRTAGTAAR